MPSFASDPTGEFTFLLAEKLGMTVADLCDRMSNIEFVRWAVFYGRRSQDMQLADGG